LLIIFQNARSEETNERILGALKAEKEELEAALNREQIQTLELKQQLAEAETRNMDLTKVKQNGLYFCVSLQFEILDLIILNKNCILHGVLLLTQ
jgi:SMC interacting uncharacterized protein involved in chromosome segregation